MKLLSIQEGEGRETQMMAYLQPARIERLLHLELNEIDDSVPALVRCLLEHVVEAISKDEAIAGTGRVVI